jgi:hypothetical protein
MRLKSIGMSALAMILFASSARAELRHVEIKTLGMD